MILLVVTTPVATCVVVMLTKVNNAREEQFFLLRMMYYSVTVILGKKKFEFAQKESKYSLPITSWNALPLSNSRLVGARFMNYRDHTKNCFGKITQQGNRKWVSNRDIGMLSPLFVVTPSPLPPVQCWNSHNSYKYA